MRIFTYISQDAPIYEAFASLNAGIDEILEVGKSVATSSNFVSNNNIRSLLQFDLTNISSSYSNGSIPFNATHYLNLNIANSTGLQKNQELDFFMVSSSWSEGSGYFVQFLKNPSDGVTWTNRDVQGDVWTNPGGDYINDGFAPSSSLNFTYPPQNVRLDVTSFIQSWISGSYNNNGFLLKLPDSNEANQIIETNIRFYSGQSHTVYAPTLETVWNSQVFVPDTGSLTLITSNGYKVYLKNIENVYYSGSSTRLDIGARSQYPVKTYDTIFTFGNTYYLPSSSYYSVVDAATNSTIVPFDVGSLISTDATGSYIDLSTQNLYPNRYYKIILKISDGVGHSNIIDTKTIFLVE